MSYNALSFNSFTWNVNFIIIYLLYQIKKLNSFRIIRIAGLRKEFNRVSRLIILCSFKLFIFLVLLLTYSFYELYLLKPLKYASFYFLQEKSILLVILLTHWLNKILVSFPYFLLLKIFVIKFRSVEFLEK